MSKHTVVRLAVLFFCMGLNIVLGKQFLSEARARLNPTIIASLERIGLLDPDATIRVEKTPEDYEKNLNARSLVEAVNAERMRSGLPVLSWNDELSGAAAEILAQAAEQEYNFDDFSVDTELSKIVAAHGYTYHSVSQSILMGPLSVDGFIDAWLSEETPNEAFEPELVKQTDEEKKTTKPRVQPVDIGMATTVVDSPQYGLVGIAIQLLGTPAPPEQAAKKQTNSGSVAVQPPVMAFRDIPDEEVISALNAYRASHNHAPYAVNDALCKYAEKRAQDLVAFGGLDAHEGFKKDFEGDVYPSELNGYVGSKIGENLAYQSCKNMTSGESFLAETGTALIEWCFDSSTKGHREAQLSTEFKNVCVRHAKGMYVVEFGS